MNEEKFDRRTALKRTLKTGMAIGAATSLSPWAMPALAQGEELVTFTDMPENYRRGPAMPGATHFLDTREISSFYTDNEDFYVVQHYGQPVLDLDNYKLTVTGLVDNEKEYSLSDLLARSQVQIDAGFECGGNRPDGLFQGLIGNANWRGVKLKDILQECGIKPEGKEVVFFGGDLGTETIRETEVEQSFARSLPLEDAMRDENLLALEMNGEPLPQFHGKPLRLLIPGFYGVANVKWLTQIHIQDRRYMGRFMGRDYVTLKKESIGDQERWVENSVTRIHLKSSIIRVTRTGNQHKISGFVLNDGTDLRSVEVKIDNGPWQEAQIDPQSSKYSWKLFSLNWNNASAGEHTLISRVTDINGNVQLTREQMPEKISRWENYGQFPRTVMIEA
ncbi:MAG: sulfite oxidase [SAR86 cluster bacterium]|uniref:Sulfite oxidase n=1 Tax=SAR86 cluster bacterium TaxID=2030880 RepID=A0A2A5B1P0_9GAMM|nr:MAG: sulfite oxidase [SAR86 cluster bacterium]